MKELNAEKARRTLASMLGRKTPGIQFAVLNEHGPVFEFSAGLANLRTGRAMTAGTTLNAYSMSKTITAAAVLLLVQTRNVGLEDRSLFRASVWPGGHYSRPPDAHRGYSESDAPTVGSSGHGSMLRGVARS